MKILFIHNAYQHRGGEDAVVDDEIALLRRHGHEVELYARDNHDIEKMGQVSLLLDTVWSRRSAREIENLLDRFRPDVAHAHNIFPLISPSVYWVLAAHGVPLVQTLHNFRALCLQAMFLREGKVCEDCLGDVPWRGVVRRCYRGSAAASAAVATTLTAHRALGSYRRKVSRYIALNQFTRAKFIQGGLPAELIAIKPNFVDLPRPLEQSRSGGLFVGRLSPEKGVDVLLGAVRQLSSTAVDVIGTGPLEKSVLAHPGVVSRGWQAPPAVYAAMARAAYLLLPSVWYENFPRTVVEAFACGLPVIASRLGAMPELIEEGRTGLLFEPGSAQDLASKIAWAETHPRAMRQMGEQARAHYEANFTPEKNYRQLMTIYGEALGRGRQTDTQREVTRAHGRV
jgi:glycosyltransferase involved in cell wall biosynthesis